MEEGPRLFADKGMRICDCKILGLTSYLLEYQWMCPAYWLEDEYIWLYTNT